MSGQSEKSADKAIDKDIESIIGSQDNKPDIKAITRIMEKTKPEIKVIIDYQESDPSYNSRNDPASDAILNFL